MAFYHLILFIALFLVLQPIAAHDGHDHNSTFVLENLCEDVKCGKGTCKASLDYAFNFICECEPGWKQIRDDEDDDFKDRFGGRRFQPCIYPNCTMNYACGVAPPPTPNVEEPHPKNISLYDPCYWAYCGDGSCNATRGHGFKCDCRPGFSNLMNVTSFPCFSDCVIGADCASLGVTLSNETSVSSPNSRSPDSRSPSNYASSIMPNFLWLIVLMVPVAMAP